MNERVPDKSTQMTPQQLERLIKRWQDNDRDAASKVLSYLRERHERFAIGLAHPWARVQDPHSLAQDALQVTCLEMDLQVVSHAYEHRSLQGLDGYFRAILQRNIGDSVKGHQRTDAIIVEVDGKIVEIKIKRRVYDGCLEMTRPIEASSDAPAAAYADEIAGSEPEPGDRALNAAAILELVEALAAVAAQFAEEARKSNKVSTVAQTIYAVITYVKLTVHLGEGTDVSIEKRIRLLDQVGNRQIEDLIRLTEAQFYPFDRHECWDCVALVLQQSQPTAKKRKERMIEAIMRMPNVPQPLLKVLRSIWRADLEQWKRKALECISPLNQCGKSAEAAFLQEIAHYLDWKATRCYVVQQKRSADMLVSPSHEDCVHNASGSGAPIYPTGQCLLTFLTTNRRECCGDLTPEALLQTLCSLKKSTQNLWPQPASLVSLFERLTGDLSRK